MRDNRFEPQLRMFQNDSSAPATPIPDSDATPIIESMSTKIKALVADLYKHNDIEKRKTSLTQRKEALSAFQSDDSVRVILVSITCGGAGFSGISSRTSLEPDGPMSRLSVESTELARSATSLLLDT
ncbi:hypothetical protein ACEPPN_007237 [Leptodophora sp. 'Broadleaf-Isolate-01']